MCASPNLVNAAVDCCGVALLCSPKIKHIRLGSTSARGARDAPTWGGSLARARLIYSAHSAQGLRLSPYLKPFPFCRTLFSCSSFPGGDDRASGGDICHFFAQPCAGDEHPPGMPAPSLSFCCARWSTPKAQTLTKLFVLGSESSYNILSTNFDFVCKRTPMSYVGSAPAHDTAGSCYAPCMRGVRSYASMAYPWHLIDGMFPSCKC